jgi:hypothetical protein
MKKFQSDELEFVYPDNWTLFVNDGDEHSGEEETNEVTLQSPNSSQLTIVLHEKFEDSDELLTRAVDAFKADYEDLEIDKASHTVAGFELVGFDITFFYLDFLVIVELRIVEREDDKVLMMIQSESREFDENRRLFEAITLSMLNPDVIK